MNIGQVKCLFVACPVPWATSGCLAEAHSLASSGIGCQ